MLQCNCGRIVFVQLLETSLCIIRPTANRVIPRSSLGSLPLRKKLKTLPTCATNRSSGSRTHNCRDCCSQKKAFFPNGFTESLRESTKFDINTVENRSVLYVLSFVNKTDVFLCRQCRDSEDLLVNKSIGCFLIRVSESRFGYSLSFRLVFVFYFAVARCIRFHL